MQTLEGANYEDFLNYTLASFLKKNSVQNFSSRVLWREELRCVDQIP